MDNKELILLIIDDNPDNLISFKALIKETFPEAQTFTATNGYKGLELASAENPDVILLDIVMPGMDGFEVCKRLKSDPELQDIPVVFITALKGDRESRIHALEVGAEAFLAKPVDNTELTAQIRAMAKIRAANHQKRGETERLEALVTMRTAELEKELELRRTTEAASLENRAMLQMILDTVPQSVFWKDTESRYLGCNRVFAQAAGLKDPHEIIGKTDFDLPWPKHEAEAYRADDKIVIEQNRSKFHIIEPLQQADGTRLWIDTSKVPLLDETGKPFALLGIYDNITERKKTEESLRKSEEQYSLINNSSRDSIYSYDTASRFTSANRSLCELLNLSAGQIIGRTHAELGFPEAQCKEWDELHRRVYETNNTVFSETTAPMPDGTMRYFEVMLNPLHDIEGNIIGIGGTTRDISERKNDQLRLLESEKRIRSYVENAPDGVVVVNEMGEYIEVNAAAERITGYSKDEMIGTSILAIIHPEDSMIAEQHFKKVMTTGEATGDARFIHKNGEIRYWTVKAVKLSENRLLGFLSDVTSQKRAGEQLQELKNRYQSLFENSLVGTGLATPDGRIIECNDAFANILGETKDDLKTMNASSFYENPEERKSITEIISQHGFLSSYETRLRRKDGGMIDVLLNVSEIKLQGEMYYQTSCLDITTRKLTELALGESEEKYRALFSDSPDAYLISVDGVFIDCNKAAEEMLRGNRLQIIGQSAEALSPEFQADGRKSADRIKEIIDLIHQKGGHNFEWIHQRFDGSLITVEIYIALINLNGRLAFFNTWRDITERKKTEEQLRWNERSLRESQRIAHVGSWNLDLATNEVIWTEELYKMYDFDPALPPPPYTEHMKLFTPASWQLLSSSLAKTRETGIPYELELETVRKDGGRGWMWVRGETTKDSKGNTTGLWGAAQDITERKQIENDLKLNKERYRIVSERTSDFTFSCLKEKGGYKLDWMAGAVEKVTGFTIEHLMEKKCWRFMVVPDDDALFVKNVLSLRPGESAKCELRILDSTRIVKWLAVDTVCMVNKDLNKISIYGGCVDITDRKLKEDLLRQSEERYKSIITVSNTGAWEFHRESGYLWCSNEYFTMLGYNPSDFMMDGSPNLKETWYDLLHPEDKDKATEKFRDYLANSSQGTYESFFRMLHKDGSWVWLWSRGQTLRNPDGSPSDVTVGTHINISEQKTAESVIRESEARYRSLLTNLGVGVVVHAPDTTIVNYNAKALEILGLTDEQMTGKTALDPQWRFIDENGDVLPFEKFTVNQVAATRQPFKDQVIGRKRNAESQTVWATVNGMPVFDANDQLSEIVISFIDITERKRSDAIREVQYNITRSIIKTERIEDLLEMIRYDLSRVLDVSNFIVALYNPEKETLRKIIFKDENDEFSEWPAASSFSGFVVKLGKTLFMNRQEIEIFARSNHLEIIGTPAACWIGVPIMIQNRVIGVIVTQSYTDTEAYSTNDVALIEMVAHEISIYLDRKQMLDDLILAKEKAEESDQLKTAFINNVSHEIRTPLNGILGFGQFLSDPGLTADERLAYFGKVQLASNRLLDTINDYMDMARIVSGTLTVHKKNFVLKPSMEEVFDEFSMLCGEKFIDFEVAFCEKAHEVIVYSDKELLVKILKELLDNAVKFTKTGKISVGCHVGETNIEFFVRDTGPGISAEKQSMIFNLFTQEDTSMTRGHEGSGLGLSIVKGIVELLGGAVWVESEKGHGATFYFTLPYGISPPQLKPLVPLSGKIPSSATKPLVLVAEDDESNFMYLEVIIRKTGCDYIHVETGIEAVEVCRQNPDITFVLMDVKMPEMNGLDATRLIREFRPNLPIIALTAYAQTGDGYRMLQSGCNEYLPKPVKPEVLKNLIKKYMQIN